jgi:geranylgeranyl pyrophosphate synthase
LLERGNPEDRAKIAAVLADRDFSRVSLDEIVELVRENGTLEKTRELARQYGERARVELRVFPDSIARRALESFPDLILSRNH